MQHYPAPAESPNPLDNLSDRDLADAIALLWSVRRTGGAGFSWHPWGSRSSSLVQILSSCGFCVARPETVEGIRGYRVL